MTRTCSMALAGRAGLPSLLVLTLRGDDDERNNCFTSSTLLLLFESINELLSFNVSSAPLAPRGLANGDTVLSSSLLLSLSLSLLSFEFLRYFFFFFFFLRKNFFLHFKTIYNNNNNHSFFKNILLLFQVI